MLVQIRNQLRFYDQIYLHVNIWKSEIEKEFSKKIIYIGVHCRRTDYAKHMKWVSGATLVDHHFFDTAFDIYRNKYNNDHNKVVFLAVSDDNKWLKVCIIKVEDLVIVNYRKTWTNMKMSDLVQTTVLEGFQIVRQLGLIYVSWQKVTTQYFLLEHLVCGDLCWQVEM